VLQSEYNFCLRPSRPLLPQSEYTFYLTLSKPSSCVQGDHSSERGDHTSERERESFTPTLSGESVCGQLLIRSILVLLFCFDVPLEKNLSKKSYNKEKKQKETKKATTKKGLCVCFIFLCAVVLCDYLCSQARVSSIV
jgi:hypothetical protein